MILSTACQPLKVPSTGQKIKQKSVSTKNHDERLVTVARYLFRLEKDPASEFLIDYLGEYILLKPR